VKIKYVLETHFHADFVSGHVDLAKATGAKIIYGPLANPSFDAHIAQDGEELVVGDIKFKVIHTPGHTMESTCYLLLDPSGKAHSIFTGDTLFIGDVGRPDLAQKAASMTQEELAGLLYDSLRQKVMTLPDDVIVYPAHGAGSACGKKMSKETVSTIGNQKESNYALRGDMTKDEFIKEVTDGLMAPPAYFPMNVAMNKEGYDAISEVIERGMQTLNPTAFEAAANETGAVILDTRNPEDFATGFIPNSINIGLNGSFAPWVGALIPDVKQQILLVTEKGTEEEAVTRLARVGFDYVIGILDGGFESWKNSGNEIDQIERYTAETLQEHFNDNANIIIDVRKPSEYADGHLEHVNNVPLDDINNQLAQFPKDKNIVLHCAGGYRSMIAASILKARGWSKVIDVIGGYSEIKKLDLPFSQKNETV